MENKKIYNEAKIEIIAFTCEDILTTSVELHPALNEDTAGDIKTPEIEF